MLGLVLGFWGGMRRLGGCRRLRLYEMCMYGLTASRRRREEHHRIFFATYQKVLHLSRLFLTTKSCSPFRAADLADLHGSSTKDSAGFDREEKRHSRDRCE